MKKKDVVYAIKCLITDSFFFSNTGTLSQFYMDLTIKLDLYQTMIFRYVDQFSFDDRYHLIIYEELQ